MTGGKRFFRRIDQFQIDDLDSRTLQLQSHLLRVFPQPLFQTLKLRPVSVQSNTEEANFQVTIEGIGFHAMDPICRTRAVLMPRKNNVSHCRTVIFPGFFLAGIETTHYADKL